MTKQRKEKRIPDVRCPTCGLKMEPIYENVVANTEGYKKPVLEITKWKCPGKCGKWIPNKETIEDIWEDEQRVKKSMSSFKGGGENNKGRKDDKKKKKRNPYDVL